MIEKRSPEAPTIASTEPHPTTAAKPAKPSTQLFVLFQSLKDAGTASVHGTYLDRHGAERAAAQAKGGGNVNPSFREARYFIEAHQVEEVELSEGKAAAVVQDERPSPSQLASESGTDHAKAMQRGETDKGVSESAHAAQTEQDIARGQSHNVKPALRHG